MTVGTTGTGPRTTLRTRRAAGALLAAGPATACLVWALQRLPDLVELLRSGASAPWDPSQWIGPLAPVTALALSLWWAACGFDELRRLPTEDRVQPAGRTGAAGSARAPRRRGLRKLFWLILGVQVLVSVAAPAQAADESASGSTPLFDPAPATNSAGAEGTSEEAASAPAPATVASTASDDRASASRAESAGTTEDASSVTAARSTVSAPEGTGQAGNLAGASGSSAAGRTSGTLPAPRSQDVSASSSPAVGTEQQRTTETVNEVSAAQDASASPLFPGPENASGTDSSGVNAETTEVVLLRGDTLWSIASERNPGASDADIMRTLHLIRQENRDVLDHGPDRILPGMILRVPVA